MAISSLSKLSVPVDGANQALLMPKLQYRFRVQFINFGVTSPPTELTKQVVDVTRPQLTFESMEIPVYNSKVYLAGKHTWNPITITLREDITNEVQRRVGEQLQKQFDFMEQSAARSGADYKFQTLIEILDGGNGAQGATVLETWDLAGCFITEANYNTLAYANNEPVTVTLNIQYDNATQLTEGVGISIGATNGTGTASTGAG